MLNLSLTVLVLFLATLISSVFGFGSALVAMPLLTLVLGLPTALPLLGLAGPVASVLVTGTSWSSVQVSASSRLLMGSLLGIPLGVWLVQVLPNQGLVRGLGGLMIAFALYRLAQIKLPTLTQPVWAYPFGFVAGVLGAAYNTNGPPVVIYGNLSHWPPQKFRATLNSYFFPSGLVILVSHALGGLWTREVFWLFGLSLPGILVAVWLGEQINRRLPVHKFDRWVFALMIGLGLLLLI